MKSNPGIRTGEYSGYNTSLQEASNKWRAERNKHTLSLRRTLGVAALTVGLAWGSIHTYNERTAPGPDSQTDNPTELVVENSHDPFCSYETFVIPQDGSVESIAENNFPGEDPAAVAMRALDVTAKAEGRTNTLPGDTERVYSNPICVPRD